MPGQQVYIEFHTRWFYLPTIITTAFLFASVGVHACYKKIRSFAANLDDDQKKVYAEIRKEREGTYWCALMQGCFVAILYIVFTTLTCGHAKPVYHLISDIMCLVFVTTYFVYTLKDKKKVMLLDGDLDDAQEKQWVGIYRCMQKTFWSKFLMGLIVSGFVLSMFDLMTPPMRVCVKQQQQQKKKQKTTNKGKKK